MIPAAVLDEYLDGLLAAAPSPASAAAVESEPAATVNDLAQFESPADVPAIPPASPPVPLPVYAAPLPARPRPAPAPVLPASAPSAGNDRGEGEASHRRAADRSSRWLRLRCGGQAYGLELLKVQEVVLPCPLLPLRGTPPCMLGVMNLRGQVVPVIDLGVHLGQPHQAACAATRIVVLEEKGETLGLRVSAVEDVVNLGDHQIESPDRGQIGRLHSDLFRGVARQSSDVVVLLNASRLLEPAANGAPSLH